MASPFLLVYLSHTMHKQRFTPKRSLMNLARMKAIFSFPVLQYIMNNDNQAFFALLLPITVHGRVSDIWRSYISQVFNKTWPLSMIITWTNHIELSLSPASFHFGRSLCCLSSSFGEYIAIFL